MILLNFVFYRVIRTYHVEVTSGATDARDASAQSA